MISSTTSRLRISSRRAGPKKSPPASRPVLMWMWRPSMRLSTTVIPLNSSMFWNERASPRRARRAGERRVMSRPSKRIFPLAGW